MAPTILVIDDDPVMRRLITTILKRNDYQVAAASGVTEALSIIERQRPDAVCCDLLMPEASGIDFLERIHESDDLADLPVIIVSAASEEDMLRRAETLGAFGHLPKPFSKAQLLELVESALRASDQ